MLCVKNLNAGYGELSILYDVSMVAREKELTVIVGPNGSGKTTLLKSIFGLATVYSGSIMLNGESIVGLPPHEIARRGIAYLPQTENVFSSLTVKENLLMAGYTLDKSEFRERLEEVLSMFPILKEFLNRRAETLSGGERGMLAMGMALMRRPQVMMFDEPTANLAPKVAMEVLRKIAELKDELGIAVILTEQNVRSALEIGDQAYLLVGGRCIFEGEAKDLLIHPELGKLYLGIKPSSFNTRRNSSVT